LELEFKLVAKNSIKVLKEFESLKTKLVHWMQILNSQKADLEEIFRLYRIASDYQRAQKTVVVWPKFQRELVLKEIEEKHQWKLMIDDKIACVWATTFSDSQIWEERNVDPAIYIHRIAVNTDFRGQNLIKNFLFFGQLTVK
jgi:hypothetical protein